MARSTITRMDPGLKDYIVATAGKVVKNLVQIAFVNFNKPRPAEKPEPEKSETQVSTPKTAPMYDRPALPTSDETTELLKSRLTKELYKSELDLTGGLRIAGKPCDCLDHKHSPFLEATAEELVAQDPGNTVYSEIIQWLRDNRHKVTVDAILSGDYANEYPQMANDFKMFRKRITNTLAQPVKTPMTLEQAKKLAAQEAEKAVEEQWKSQPTT